MMSQRGFALLEVLLAVVLMMVAAAASYTLVKGFRANASTQQFIRYATTITQNATPFLDDNNYTAILGGTSGNELSTNFLTTIGIPSDDQTNSTPVGTNSGLGACPLSTSTTPYFCYVESGMHNSKGEEQSMSFFIRTTSADTSLRYFVINVMATGAQAKQVLQNAGTLFSVFCSSSGSEPATGDAVCSLSDLVDNQSYGLWLVFPKTTTYSSTVV